MMQQSSESIQRQMETQAFQIPGLASLPYTKVFVKLVADYLAVLYREQRDTRSDLYRNFVDRVFPEPEGRPSPAHALAHASPASRETELQTDWTFIAADQPEVFFAPVYPVRLLPFYIRYQASGQTLHEYVDDKKIETVRFTEQSLPENGLWLGLEVREKIPLNGLNFLFDGLPEDKYALLPLIRFRIGQKLLDTAQGFLCYKDHIKPAFPDAEYLRLERIKRTICDRYAQQFITVNQHENSCCLPEQSGSAYLEPLLPEHLKAQNLLWLELIFPDGFTSAELANLDIRLNCFPVWNARICRERGTYSTQTAIIPLAGNEEGEPLRNAFLGMVNVWSDDTNYLPAALSMRQKIGYTIQCGHLANTGQAELLLRIHDIVQRLDEESVQYKTDHAYGLPAFDNLLEPLNMVKAGLTELNKQMGQLPAHLLRPHYYLRLNLGAQDKNMIYFDYYVTQGRSVMERLWPAQIPLVPAKEATGLSLISNAKLLTIPVDGRDEWTLAEKEQLIQQRIFTTASTSAPKP